MLLFSSFAYLSWLSPAADWKLSAEVRCWFKIKDAYHDILQAVAVIWSYETDGQTQVTKTPWSAIAVKVGLRTALPCVSCRYTNVELSECLLFSFFFDFFFLSGFLHLTNYFKSAEGLSLSHWDKWYQTQEHNAVSLLALWCENSFIFAL